MKDEFDFGSGEDGSLLPEDFRMGDNVAYVSLPLIIHVDGVKVVDLLDPEVIDQVLLGVTDDSKPIINSAIDVKTDILVQFDMDLSLELEFGGDLIVLGMWAGALGMLFAATDRVISIVPEILSEDYVEAMTILSSEMSSGDCDGCESCGGCDTPPDDDIPFGGPDNPMRHWDDEPDDGNENPAGDPIDFDEEFD